MKLKLIIIALVVLGLGACTQRTCPTYAKEEVKQEKQEHSPSEASV